MNTASLTPFNGSDYDHDRDAPRLTDQMDRVFNALSNKQWHTLEEIAAITGDPTPSISAQIRHLRKARFGGWEILKIHQGNGLFAYRMTGGKVRPASEPPADPAPLPPAAPELLKIAHKELSQMKGELDTAHEKVAALTAALESIIRAVPAGASSGELFYEHFDGEGNYQGSEQVDPISIIQAMAAHAEEGLSAAARIDSEIPTETS